MDMHCVRSSVQEAGEYVHVKTFTYFHQRDVCAQLQPLSSRLITTPNAGGRTPPRAAPSNVALPGPHPQCELFLLGTYSTPWHGPLASLLVSHVRLPGDFLPGDGVAALLAPPSSACPARPRRFV